MIFGDRQDFAVQVDRFDPPWPDLPAHEDAVWAATSFWVAGVNITEHRRNGTDRILDAVHMPLRPLAQWWSTMRAPLRFEERSQLGNLHSPHLELDRWSEALPPARVDDATWFDRRDAWWSRHFTGAATSDVIVPSVGIVRSDDRALVSWRVPTLARPDRSFVRSAGVATVSWPGVAAALSEFASTLSEWSPDVQLDEPTAHEGSPLEYYTGLAADELPSFGFWPQAATDPAVDPLAQVVRDLTHRTATSGAQRSIVEFVRDSRGSSSTEWWSARARLLPGDGLDLEREGYDAAQALRAWAGLDGQPIDDMEGLTRELGIDIASASPTSTADRMVVKGTAAGHASLMVLTTERTRTPWAKRFECARGLGHLMLDPLRGEAIGAASGPQAMASRRRKSGAFAAELLLPTSALMEASEGALDGITEGDRFGRLLNDYAVGAATAAFQLWNQGLLSSTEVRDNLIESR